MRSVVSAWWLLAVLIAVLAACASDPIAEGPRLVQDFTLAPTEVEGVLPTRFLSPTPERTLPPDPTAAPPGEVLSPLEEITLEADFVLVTPTLPPSKTPTATPTITETPTITPSPTLTATATATMPAFPTSIIIPVTAPVANPVPQVCDSTWFFIEPRPASCPLNPPMADQGVYQEFQNGYMIWIRPQVAIYVLYHDGTQPRWQVFRDHFVEGMPEFDAAYIDSPFPGTWQPRRGFGLLWRSNQAVRDRIGWATMEWEQPYSAQTQTAADGTVFISVPTGVFSLQPGGTGWNLHRSFSGF
jgi:hypothetical protein